MRKTVAFLAILAAFLIDAFVFTETGAVRSFMPEALTALFVSFGVLTGVAPMALAAVIVGAIEDIMFNGILGISSGTLFLAVVVGALFYNRFYADNAIIPSLIAAALMFVKEHIVLVVVLIAGGRVTDYFSILIKHILPASVLTGVLCLFIHFVLKKTLFTAEWRRDIDHLR